MKKFSKAIFSFAAAVLTFVATVSTANACLLLHYQPEVPESLREK